MRNLEVLLRRADKFLRDAEQETDRRANRELLVQAYNNLKMAEEMEAQQIAGWRDLP